MIEMIKEILMMLGICVVGLAIYVLFCTTINKFNRWRKNGCKIKCLCKPHVYEFDFCWPNSGELGLKCKKCGKRKRLYIDTESFKDSQTGGILWTRKKQ